MAERNVKWWSRYNELRGAREQREDAGLYSNVAGSYIPLGQVRLRVHVHSADRAMARIHAKYIGNLRKASVAGLHCIAAQFNLNALI